MEPQQMTRKRIALCIDVDSTESERKRVTPEVPYTSTAAVCWRVTCDQLVSDPTGYANMLCKDIRDMLQEFLEKDPNVLEVLKNPESLIPYGLPSEVILEIICRYPCSFSRIPIDLRSYDKCLTAITQYGWVLQHVPLNLRTEQICLAAATQYGWALQHVPLNLRTEQICLAAVTQYGWALKHVPLNLRTEQIGLVAVMQRGQALKFMPEELRTEQLCLAAVTQCRWALHLVPKDLRTTLTFCHYYATPNSLDAASRRN